jgi:singapore isolate B (sub-type 7) whole genome shotgun sequence assembly, scaffold_4
MMHEDDALFDSLRITPSILTKEKKSWSDVVGHNYTIPLQQQTTEEPVKQSTEVCRYWLNGNCIYGDKCWYAHHTTPQEETRKQPFFDEISTTCCICQDDILKSHKRFGLMQSTLFGWSLP